MPADPRFFSSEEAQVIAHRPQSKLFENYRTYWMVIRKGIQPSTWRLLQTPIKQVGRHKSRQIEPGMQYFVKLYSLYR